MCELNNRQDVIFKHLFVKINDCSMEARRFAVLDYINKLGWANILFDKNIKTIQGKIVGKVVVKM